MSAISFNLSFKPPLKAQNRPLDVIILAICPRHSQHLQLAAFLDFICKQISQQIWHQNSISNWLLYTDWFKNLD